MSIPPPPRVVASAPPPPPLAYRDLYNEIEAAGPTVTSGGGYNVDATGGESGGSSYYVEPSTSEEYVIYKGDKGYIRDPNTNVIREFYTKEPDRRFNDEAQASGYYTNVYNPDGTVSREFNRQKGEWEKLRPLVLATIGLAAGGYGLGALGAAGAGAGAGAGALTAGEIAAGAAGAAGTEFAGLSPSLFAGAEGLTAAELAVLDAAAAAEVASGSSLGGAGSAGSLSIPPSYGTVVPGTGSEEGIMDRLLKEGGKRLGKSALRSILDGGDASGGQGGGANDLGNTLGGDFATLLGAIAGGSGVGSNTGGAKGFDWEKLRNPPAPTDPINWGKIQVRGGDPYAPVPSGDYSNLARDLGVSGGASASATPHYTFGQPVKPSDIMGLIDSGKSAASNTGGALGNLFRPPMINTGEGSGGNPDPESGNYSFTPGLRGGGGVHADHPGVPVVEGRFDYRKGAAVNGPGDGQSDDIPAMLADGEYVIDAELVSMLGNGSNKAGAKVLDKFREAVRDHKRSAPLGKIPPKSKSPLAYLKEAQNG